MGHVSYIYGFWIDSRLKLILSLRVSKSRLEAAVGIGVRVSKSSLGLASTLSLVRAGLAYHHVLHRYIYPVLN